MPHKPLAFSVGQKSIPRSHKALVLNRSEKTAHSRRFSAGKSSRAI